MKNISLLLLFLCLCNWSFEQKRVLSYPFEFEKSFLQKSDYDAYFLDNKQAGNLSFILKDNKKVNYVMIDGEFKTLSQFTKQVEGTVFDRECEYVGGTAEKNVYHYVYKVTDKRLFSSSVTSYLEETIDFDNKSVSSKKAFDIPREEQVLASFSDHNHYFTITANKKTSDLLFYEITGNGEPKTKSVHFTIPPDKKKDKNELTEYLDKLKIVREGEEPGLDVATHSAKLFCYKDNLVFDINDGDSPTHLFAVNLEDFSGTDQFIDHSALVEKENRGKSYVSSFLKQHRLFTLVLNKKDIKVAVYNCNDGMLINKTVIDEDNGITLMAEPPVTETRMGNNVKTKDVDDIKKVIKAFTKGTEGLTVSTNKEGQYILQVGTYDPVPQPGSAGGGGHWEGGFDRAPAPKGSVYEGQMVPVYNPNKYYIFGNSAYMAPSARYNTTTYFKVMLDPSTCKPVHGGRVPLSVADQVKNYMDGADKKSKAIKQFALEERQFYGYYDRDMRAYIIEEIPIRK